MKRNPTHVRRVKALEEKLLSIEVRRSKAALESLLADDFIEIGRSGRAYNKAQVIEALLRGSASLAPTFSEFKVHMLADGLFLATYFSVNKVNNLASRRSSIWRKTGNSWQMVFHQGTPAAADS